MARKNFRYAKDLKNFNKFFKGIARNGLGLVNGKETRQIGNSIFRYLFMDLHGPIAICESNLTMEIVMGFVVDEYFLAMSYSFLSANQYLNIEPLVDYVRVIVAKAINMIVGGFMSFIGIVSLVYSQLFVEAFCGCPITTTKEP
ncbi:hypothetical protein SLA2020_059160 [Shorea laevis]